MGVQRQHISINFSWSTICVRLSDYSFKPDGNYIYHYTSRSKIKKLYRFLTTHGFRTVLRKKIWSFAITASTFDLCNGHAVCFLRDGNWVFRRYLDEHRTSAGYQHSSESAHVRVTTDMTFSGSKFSSTVQPTLTFKNEINISFKVILRRNNEYFRNRINRMDLLR